MCGRARCTLRVDDVGRACGFSAPLRTLPDSDRFRPSYNVSPGRYMPVVRYSQGAGDSSEDSREPVVHCMKWGLIPSFTKTNEKPDHFRMFNARSESVHVKSSFRRLLPKSRCLATVEGFYEWKKDGAKKQPYYVHFKDGRSLVFAGLYDSWKDAEGNILYTFTILTTRSSKALDWLHDRMPVILPNQEAINSWLNDDLQESALHKLTQPYENADLVWYPVTSAMGKPTFDSPDCIKEIKPKLASNSEIAQLFGKKRVDSASHVHLGAAKKDSSLSPQLLEDVPASPSAEQDEELLTEYERKSLLAGVDPDQNITETPMMEQEMDGRTGGTEVCNNNVNNQDEKACDNSMKNVSEKGGTAHLPTIASLSAEDPQDGKETQDCSKRGLEVPQNTLQSRRARQGVKDSSMAKRQKLASSPKALNKNGDIIRAKDKQSTLRSFFGKG